MKYDFLALLVGSALAVSGCGDGTGGSSGENPNQCMEDADWYVVYNAAYDFNTQSMDAAVAAAGYQYADPVALNALQRIYIKQLDMRADYGQDKMISISDLAAASTPAANGTWPYFTAGVVYQVTLMGSTQTYVAGDSRNRNYDMFVTNNKQQLGRLLTHPHSISQQTVTSCTHICGGQRLVTTQTLYAVDASYLGDVNVTYDEKDVTVNEPAQCTIYAP